VEVTDFVDPFAAFRDATAPAVAPTAESVETPPAEPAAPAEPVAGVDHAAQERALAAAMAEYIAMIPAIETAQPLPATAGQRVELRGGERIAASIRSLLWDTLVAGLGYTLTISINQDAIVVELGGVPVIDLYDYAQYLGGYLAAQGNIGTFEWHVRSRDNFIVLVRRGVAGPGGAWRSAGPKPGHFFADTDYRNSIFDLCRLRQVRTSDGAKRFPKVREFGEDDRGGTAVLDLPPGMLLGAVESAEAALRQALNSPDLVVDHMGMRPLIRLNSKRLANEFPKENPLRMEMFTRPRTMAERHVAAPDFVIPLGVRADGSPILVKQSVAPHMAIFGGTGAGKTVLLTSIVKAAVLQGAAVILADAKNGKDLRGLALQNLPGVVHYAAGSEAGLHRVVRYVRDEFERRRTLAARLQQQGIEYQPTPMLLVFDEVGAWLDDQLSGGDREAKAAASATLAHLSYIAAQAREQKCFLLVAGQHAYVSAFSGRWKSNTSTLVVLGPPTENHRQALFAAGEQRDQVRDLGGQITKSMKGRGLVADTETGAVQLFQGSFTPPGPDADALAIALRETPRLRRFSWKFPLPGDDGGDGSWQDWTPVSEPSSDSLPVVILDGPDGSPDPSVAIFDPTSSAYAPGAKPLSAAHHHVNSYD
jgi:FtsK/SpoIIIE family